MADQDEAETAAQTHHRASFRLGIRANFLTGLVVIAPAGLTIYLVWAIITLIDAWIVPLVPSDYNPSTYLDIDIPGFGVVVFLIFTTFAGMLARRVFGRQLIRFGEALIDRTPIVRPIYNAIKQIAETALSQSKTSFKNACLVEYPRKGIWAIAFIATETTGEVPGKAGFGEMISIFLPTTPNPTSGFLLFVPKENVRILDMTVEEAAKLVISAGLVTPPIKPNSEERKSGAKT